MMGASDSDAESSAILGSDQSESDSEESENFESEDTEGDEYAPVSPLLFRRQCKTHSFFPVR